MVEHSRVGRQVAKKSVRIFIILSLLFVGLDIIFILINFYSSKKALNNQFFQVGRELEAAFIQARQATEQRMLQVAACVAADPGVEQLFLAGKEAVAAEGGGPGGARATAARLKLYRRLAASRNVLTAENDFSQLHFYLVPGALSFLRVHAPDRFGDRMDSVRSMVVTVNRTRQPVAGFETGRIYSGIRGVVPVFAEDQAAGRQVYVGALEAGTSCQTTLENAAEPRHVGMAVLLTLDHLKSHVRPEYLKKLIQGKTLVSGLVLKATTGPGIVSILDDGLLPPGLQSFAWQVAEISSVPYLIVRFPLYDFSGIRDQSLPPVGSIVAWRNVGRDREIFTNGLKTNIFYGLFAFILTELLLYFGIYLRAKKLENMLTHGRLELAHSLEKLQESEEKFEAMAEYSVDWDAWHGTDGRYLYITPSCKEISGYSREVFTRDPDFFASIIHPDDRQRFLDHQKQHHRGASEPAEITFRILRKDGEMRWIWHKCQAMFGRDGTWRGRRTTNRDVTALKEAEEKLQRLSTTDPLTGAYNRRMFMDMLVREMTRSGRYGEPFSLLMVDIDHFKKVNDTYGHDAGDRVLVEMVELSMELIRQSDILARWGGEEFMVLLPQTNPDRALALGERLRQRISEYRFTGVGRLTVSIGVAHQQQLDTIDSLLKRVDTALYRAKETGRNRVVTG